MGILALSLAYSVPSYASPLQFSSPAPSSFPPSVPFSFPSGVFPSPSVSHPAPPAGPWAPAPTPLASSLPFRPPFVSGSAPSAPSSFSFLVSSLLSFTPSLILLGSFAPLAPVSASSVASFSSPLPFVSSASSSSTAVSWSLPSVVSYSAPPLASLSAPAPVPPPPLQVFFCLVLLSLPLWFLLVSLLFLLQDLWGSFLFSSLFVPSVVSASASGVSASDPPSNSFPLASASGADFSDPCYFRDFDDSSTKGEKESPALGKGESLKIFHEVVSLIMSFFPRAKSASPSSSLESFPWLHIFNVSQQRDPSKPTGKSLYTGQT